VKVRKIHPFDLPPREAVLLQRWLASRVMPHGGAPRPLRLVAGADCSLAPNGTLHAAIVVLEAPAFGLVEVATASGRPGMPYIPGLLSFRETPILLEALRRLSTRPDVLLVDGQGMAHPRRLGIASHLGLHLDLPVVGVAKSRLVGEHEEPGRARGEWTSLRHEGERIGAVLRTKDGVRPVYVSVGDRIGLLPAVRTVLACCTRYRLPEPIRAADRVSRTLARSAGSRRRKAAVRSRSHRVGHGGPGPG
jgi:deoxyribonuclease V